ncbi:MAG: LacI family transcriptional regulator [Anaerolineae bacterium]|jgi:LacI family transcriptional regulator|nr:LacI family transcriptional regulator [Anaerolineae bacterium]MDH7473697.1 LacI family DNA-binding transcriptional regulator [Anaerolineae bacterium]
MRRKKGTVTIQDVAETAGVSVSTVSRVLNNKDDVAPATYEKVQRVIEELGYTSSLAARSMRSRRTGVIGLIVPDVGDPFSILVMKGVNRAITELDYDLIIYTSGSIKKRSAAERERHFVSLLNGSIADGVIIVTPAATTFSTAAPVVTIDPNNECPECLTIIATNHAGAIAAMEYLIGLGHRRIGFISGRPDLQSANHRLQGYLDALRQANIPQDPALIEIGDFSRETGRICARRLLSLPEPPTAIFAANDQSAFGAIEAAREMGLRVPDDLSVVGFDNIPEAAYYNPALTTVDQFIEQMGYVATEMLLGLVQGEPLENDLHLMPTQLVVRDSCRAITGNA